MNSLLLYEDHAYEQCKKAILGWPAEHSHDTYAIALLYSSGASADAQGREIDYQAGIGVYYNTWSHYRLKSAETSNADEAMWLVGYWFPSVLTVPVIAEYGEEPDDEELALRDAWCVRQNVPRFSRMEKDESGRPVYDEHTLYSATAALCEQIAARLHKEGILLEKFGRPLPIIIQTDDYSEECLKATESANPPECLRSFIQYYEDRYSGYEVYHFYTLAGRGNRVQ